jgi:hypothetical protein
MASTIVPIGPTCACGCGQPARRSFTGRPGRWFSDACKQKGYRQRLVTKANKESVTKQPDILFYCGLNERYWNHHAVEPGKYVCIAPFTSSEVEDKKTGEKRRALRKTHVLIDDTKVEHVMVDSCAFSERIELQDFVIVKNERLSFNDALQRQIAHAYEFRYAHLVESIVSYDLLIDETWQDGERSKARWSVKAAEYAVEETIKAAQYLASQRRRIDGAFGHHVRLVLSAQGVEAEQYARCAEEIVKVMKPDDIFGLGGWCITGLIRHEMLPAAAAILPGVFEVLGRANVKRVHVFGVIIPALLGFLLYLCDQYGIQLSTDSAGPCVEPARNGNWGYGSWTNPTYKVAPILESCKVLDEEGNKAPICTPDTICRGLDRIRHVALTREWLAHFREREVQHYRMLPTPSHRQLALFAEEVPA